MTTKEEDYKACIEFKDKTYEKILETLRNRNTNIIDIDLINCSKWIYSVMKEAK